MNNENKNQRARNFACITYHTEDVIKSVLELYAGAINHYVYICHDKDYKDDGTLKEKHYHVILSFYNARTVSAVRKLFPSNQNTLAQIVHDKTAMFAYLTHEDEPEKVQYDKSLVVCDDMNYWDKLSTVGENDNRTLSLLEDIIKRVPLREMVLRYGRDFVINRQNYYFFARMLMREDDYLREKKEIEELNNRQYDEDGILISDSVMQEGMRDSYPSAKQVKMAENPFDESSEEVEV